MQLSIQPSVGIARLGNSPDQICLSPDTIGGLPFEADSHGNSTGPISTFKDKKGLIKRQGQLFKIFDEAGTELTLDHEFVAGINWTVHLANKKAAWYQYSELQGNLLYGNENSYTNQKIDLRNPKITGTDRQTLIIDPGPRQISGKLQSIGFNKEAAPANYPVQYPPGNVKHGLPVTTLGDLLTDSSGRLVVLGGFGNAGGTLPLTSYGGSSSWHDDIADGPVYCTVSFKDDRPPVMLSSWVVVGSPDFAPEIVNISNLSDTMFDVGIRCLNLAPEIFKDGIWNKNYIVNFYRDILPVIQRISRYQWVANVQPMMAFASNVFDFSDPSGHNKANRKNYLAYFRQNDAQPPVPPALPQEQLFRNQGQDMFPMMPVNSGSNSVSNTNIMKFLSLDETQLFFMTQWADGHFVSDRTYKPYPVHPLSAASVGNCVGLPMCPGIEVTWNTQNPAVYAEPYVIRQFKNETWYQQHGLTPSRDECEGGGCEPGDLTKRMACPWQADFFQCTIQYINFTDQSVNKYKSKDGTPAPKPPVYYAYWWPPQSPWDVLVGEFTVEGQDQTNVPAGQQMNYARGVNSFTQMVEHWSALGFIRDKNPGSEGFPFMVETERNNELFTYKDVPVGKISGNKDDNETMIPVFYIEPDKKVIKSRSTKGLMMVEHMELKAFKDIEIAPQGLEKPRSGTRNRR